MRTTFTVPSHSEVVLSLERQRQAVRLARAAVGEGRAVRLPRAPISPITASVYDIGTFYSASDDVGSYREIDTEIMRPTMTRTDLAAMTKDMIEGVMKTRAAISGREIWSPHQLQAGTTETDGLITNLSLSMDGAARRTVDLISSGPTWVPRPTPESKLEALGLLDAPISKLTEHLQRVKHETFEQWDNPTAARVGRDGTVRFTGCLEGQWDIAASSVRSFLSFDVADRETYRVTAYPSPRAPEVYCPVLSTCPTTLTHVDVFLAPRMYQFLIRWIAVYLFVTLFNWGYRASPNTGTCMLRLPFYPTQYDLNSHSGGVGGTNSVAVSERIRRTRTYARMIAQDLALQVFSPYYMLLLAYRTKGSCEIYQREIPADALCARLRFQYNDGGGIDRFVWRKTVDPKPFLLVDTVSLNVPGEVIGDDGSIFILPL